MSYITLITNAGLAKITAALAGGTQISMGAIAVGDGNGTTPVPGQNQTSLVREVYRSAVNQVAINDEGKLVAEIVIPQTVGGFTVREIALFDSDGALFAVGSTPTIQKPNVIENAAAELVLRLIVSISNSAVIQLTAAGTIIATRDWVESNFALDSLLGGGTTNQILAKRSNLDGDTEWRDPSAVNIKVDVIEETKTLTANQTVINLTTVTTVGAAVYVEGIRLPRSRYTVNSVTQLTLNQAYPVGTLVTIVQNEPAAQIEAVPVGQVVMLGLSATPQQLFGYGTWEQVGKGRAIFGLDDTDSDFNTLAKTGGGKTHSHSGSTSANGSHNHSGSTAAGGNHDHGGVSGSGGAHDHGATTAFAGDHSHGGATGSGGSHTHGGETASGGNHSHGNFTGSTTLTEAQLPAHDHAYLDRYQSENSAYTGAATNKEAMPSFHNNNLGVGDSDNDNNTFLYIEKETGTAGAGEAHNHTISNSGDHKHGITADGNHNHSINSSGTHAHQIAAAANHNHTISGSGTHAHDIAGDGSHSHSVTTGTASSLPPYYTVALWMRTA